MSLMTSTKTEVNTVELVFEVNAEQFEIAVEKAYQKVKKNISLPGFRKGKVSRKMAETRMGEGVFYEDAINALINEELPKAIEDEKLDIVDRPQIDVEEVSKETGLKFKALCITKPVVEISDYMGIAVAKPVREVTDADVDAQIENLRKRNARLVSVDDRAAQMNDTVSLDFEGFFGDTPFEGGKGENFELTLGSGQFIPGFEEQVVGKSIEEDFDVVVTFPEDYQMEDYAGKEAVFKCKIHGITFEELPEVDDEFIQDCSEFDTVDAFRADAKAKLIETAASQAESSFENAVLQAIIDKVDAPIPNCMIEQRINSLVANFENVLKSSGMNLDLYLQYTGMDINDYRDQNRDRATSEVKLRLALEKIAELEGIEPTQDEINSGLQKMAEDNSIEMAKLLQYISLPDYITDLKVTKAIEMIKASAVVAETAEESAAE